MLASDGGWKLSGFSFATACGPGPAGGVAAAAGDLPFNFSDPFPALCEEYTKAS